MLKTFLSILVLFCLLKAEGQFSFKSNDNYKLRDISLLDSIFQIDQEYDFQLRIWTGGGLLPTSSLFLFSVKGNDTTTRFFRLKSIDSTKILYWTEVPVSINTKDYWTYVNSRHIRELPSMKQIFQKYNLEEQRTMDGISFWIELLSKNSRRGSWYHCPQSNFRNHPKAIELKWITEILEATIHILKEKLLLCKTAANMGFGVMAA
jgi:hypothetical protein